MPCAGMTEAEEEYVAGYKQYNSQYNGNFRKHP